MSKLTFKEPVFLYETRKVNGNRKSMYRCSCGNEFETYTTQVNIGRTRSCGCFRKSELVRTRTTHGETGSKIYATWLNMKARCYNKKSTFYHRYGGRGITVCEQWLDSFEDFCSDMGTKPSRTHSIDRINNDGNYEPNNCKWSTKSEQMANRGWSKYNTSGYKNVSKSTREGKWIACITRDGKTNRLGYYKCKHEAAMVVDMFKEKMGIDPYNKGVMK